MAEHFRLAHEEVVSTEFGRATLYEGEGLGFLVLPRHGIGHTTLPHEINYRANMAALRKLGVRTVIATSAVGSMNEGFRVGEAGIVEQFIDFTRTRPATILKGKIAHTDMTEPYSPRANRAILRASEKVGPKIHPGLVYVCVDGPRFETPAEIRMFRKMGGDVVGMTGVPEVVFANELGIDYSSIVIAANWAAGTHGKVNHDEVLGVMRKVTPKVKKLIEETVNLLSPQPRAAK